MLRKDGKIGAGAAAVFEEHRLAHRQPHDVFHRVVDRLNETGAALRIFVLRRGALGLSSLAIVEIISSPGVFPDAVLVIKPDVEPDRAVERAMLIHAEPGQFVVENFRRFRVGEITVGNSAIGDRAGDAMDQLPHGSLATAFMRVGPIGDVAVEIFGDRDFRRERGSSFSGPRCLPV